MRQTVSFLNSQSVLLSPPPVVEEFEIIEPSAIDQLGMSWQSPEEKNSLKKKLEREEALKRQSPRTKARQRWKDAIKQQIMLNQMDKKNELVKRKCSYV